MDYGKMKVVELRAELQARGLDTKGVKAALIDRLKEAMDLEEQQGGAPVIAAVPAAAQDPPDVDTPKRRRSSRSRTKSPEPVFAKSQDPALEAVAEEPEESSQTQNYEQDIDEMEVDENAGDVNEDELLAEPEDDQGGTDEAAAPAMESESQATGDEKTDEENRGTKRRSDSPSKGQTPKKRQRLPPPNIDDFVADEDEPELDESTLQLSWFDSDLNLKINRETFCSALSLSDTGLALVWAGARANFGAISNGKYFFEVHLASFNTKINYPNERNLHELRCGWSTPSASLQLGEHPLSYGIDTSGKKCNNSQFTEYATRLHAEDVVGVHLVIDDDKCSIQFTVNGKDKGVAFEFEKSTLNGEALFPHISTKNVEYKVNFGQLENSIWSDVRDKYKENELRRRRLDLERKKREIERKRDEKIKKEADAVKKVEADAAKKAEEATKKASEAENAPAEGEGEAEGEAKVEAEEKADAEAPPAEEAAAEPAQEEQKEPEPEEPAVILPDDISAEEIEADTPHGNRLDGYTYISQCPLDQLVKGPRRPETRAECEVIMMIGLPGAGKSYWALQRSTENPDKRYTLLGTKYLLERMKLHGVPRKPGSGPGRWEKLIELCNRGLLTLNDIACKRRRNYILDQPHVYISDQRRKMRVYGDFKRTAVIVVSSEEEYKKRFKLRMDVEGKDIPDRAVNEMRANLTLPELEYLWFNEIVYTDLEKEEAEAEVTKENERGKKALSQRNRQNDFNRGGFNNRNNRGWGGRNDRNNFGGRNWGPPNQGGPRGGPMGGGGGFRRDFDFNNRGGGGGGNWNGPNNWNNRPRQGGYGGAPPPRPGQRKQDNNTRGGNRPNFRNQGGNNNSNNNRNRQDGNRPDGNKKFGNKNNWQGGSGGGGGGNWNNWGNSYGGGGGNQGGGGGGWFNNQQYGNDGASDPNQQQWTAYYQQQQQAGQQNWYSDQNYGGAFSSNSSYDNQSKQ